MSARDADALISSTQNHMEWFGAGKTRVIGYPEHDAAMNQLLEIVQDIPGIQVWTHTFPVVAPVMEDAVLEVQSGPHAGEHTVYAFWPASSRLNTTPSEGIAGPIVYCGMGTMDEIPARGLTGGIAAVEFHSMENYRNPIGFGAHAVLLIGSPHDTHIEARFHEKFIPVNISRFYVPDGPLADALRRGDLTHGRLISRGEWREVMATNIYALVPPRDLSLQRKAIVLACQSDAMSIAPGFAPGGNAAINTAALLSMLEYYAARSAAGDGPEHPLLFTFLDAYAINMRGMREMLAALAVTEAERRTDHRDDVNRRDEYERVQQLAEELTDDPDAILRVCQPQYRSLHRYIKDEAALEVADIDNRLHPRRVALQSAEENIRPRLEAEIDQLTERRAIINTVRSQMLGSTGFLSGRWGPDDDTARISPEYIDDAQALWNKVQERLEGQLRYAEERIERYTARDAIRVEICDALGLAHNEIPVHFIFGFDITDMGVSVGPIVFGNYIHNWDTVNADPFMDWIDRVYHDEGELVWPGELIHAISLEVHTTSDVKPCFIVGWVHAFTSMVTSFGLPSITWSCPDTFRRSMDTPNDCITQINWDRLPTLLNASFRLIDRMVYDPSFDATARLEKQWRRVKGSIVDQAPGEPVARLPKSGYLTSLVMGDAAGYFGMQTGRYHPRWWLAGVGAIRRQEFVFTEPDGMFYFDDYPAIGWDEVMRLSLQSHLLDDDGEIISAINLRQAGRGVNVNTLIRMADRSPLRGVVYPCAELNIFHLYDPRFLVDLFGLSFLDARRGGIPRRLNFGVSDGILSALIEPETRWQLIMRIGITANRMMLLNIEDDPDLDLREAARGYGVFEPLPTHPVHASAHDITLLNNRRLEDYRRAGITSRAIDDIRIRTDQLLEQADKAREEDNAGALFYAATGALSNELRGYRAIRDLGNDVVRTAIFLLLALIPFSFAMERLLFASTGVYRQLGLTMLIFAVMTAILWSFHPAFRISNQPLIIIMAFGIIFMSLLVLSMLFGKFRENIEELKSRQAEAGGAHTSRMGVALTALKLGIANMRKRKLRTALTGTTIVLITFALLCFMSTSTYSGQREFTVRSDRIPPYTGVLLRHPSQRRIYDRVVMYVENMVNHITFPEEIGAPEKMDVAYRYWWQDPWHRNWRIHVRNPRNGVQVSLRSAMGLSDTEHLFSGVEQVLPNWERFTELSVESRTKGGGCYVSAEVAEELGIVPGDTIAVAGYDMELVGVFNANQFREYVYDLDGVDLTPLDFSAMGEMERVRTIQGDWNIAMLANEIESGNIVSATWDLPHMTAAQVIILPAPMIHGMYHSTIRSIAIRTDTVEQATHLASEAVQRFAFPAYLGSPETGIRVMATTPLIPKAPRSLFILLVLAGLIIFNTMMSSIAERKREIYIYTSLGLAPFHIGMLFLAEAVTYGLMGSVFGYIVGQGLATLFSNLGWLGGMTLNYSGSQAMATMGLVLGVVIISSLAPAYLAGKLAVPSNEMRWKVPNPEEGRICDSLPFTVTHSAVGGVMAYLYDYFDAHKEGSIGCFTTDALEKTVVNLENKDISLPAISSTVWLAPYDLGVRQDIIIRAVPGDEEDVLGLIIELKQSAGQSANWMKLNRTFLSDLRRRLLGWRNLRTDRILEYITKAGDTEALESVPGVIRPQM